LTRVGEGLDSSFLRPGYVNPIRVTLRASVEDERGSDRQLRQAQYGPVCEWGIPDHGRLQRVTAIGMPVFVANDVRVPQGVTRSGVEAALRVSSGGEQMVDSPAQVSITTVSVH
jgi:hypothetical protein